MTTYRLIATDLDETLLNDERKVSEKNRQAIDQARKQGAKFVLATGRPYFTTYGTQKEVGIYKERDEYTISLNGAVVVENETGKPLFVEGMPFETIKTLFDKGIEYDVGVHIYTDDTVWCTRLTEDEKAYINGRMDVREFEGTDLDFLRDTNLVKILFVNTDEAYLNEMEKELSKLCPGLEVSYSSNRYLEFNKAGIHKGYGLHKLGEILGIPTEEMIAVGDNFNDLGMIEEAGLGVGVANSNPGIVERCDVITDNDCNHDAIAEVIDKYILQK